MKDRKNDLFFLAMEWIELPPLGSEVHVAIDCATI